ncbi:hypothetical protein BJ875DRAFT_235080 [Amylocarpus encephaloides]|uniref:Uncharacterized protein n=1 Tax=Amylocarpus encephaloides TaxID=45428 RepID=A0A9P7Y7F2_9HELO|nr:hypothetical protein BJ875DRAFT_235080 [Amylocarpus encephaloides]
MCNGDMAQMPLGEDVPEMIRLEDSVTTVRYVSLCRAPVNSRFTIAIFARLRSVDGRSEALEAISLTICSYGQTYGTVRRPEWALTSLFQTTYLLQPIRHRHWNNWEEGFMSPSLTPLGSLWTPPLQSILLYQMPLPQAPPIRSKIRSSAPGQTAANYDGAVSTRDKGDIDPPCVFYHSTPYTGDVQPDLISPTSRLEDLGLPRNIQFPVTIKISRIRFDFITDHLPKAGIYRIPRATKAFSLRRSRMIRGVAESSQSSIQVRTRRAPKWSSNSK